MHAYVQVMLELVYLYEHGLSSNICNAFKIHMQHAQILQHALRICN